mmetsp:Transcript_36787/g.54046  ORF Transcript_36787/g.54046 Transcript_36787/m.54046 type:complete len:206 (+) Transcript_36787:32-649(+)
MTHTIYEALSKAATSMDWMSSGNFSSRTSMRSSEPTRSSWTMHWTMSLNRPKAMGWRWWPSPHLQPASRVQRSSSQFSSFSSQNSPSSFTCLTFSARALRSVSASYGLISKTMRDLPIGGRLWLLFLASFLALAAAAALALAAAARSSLELSSSSSPKRPSMPESLSSPLEAAASALGAAPTETERPATAGALARSSAEKLAMWL